MIEVSLPLLSPSNDKGITEDKERTRTCGECDQYVGKKQLVKRGFIPHSMSDVFVTHLTKPIQKRTMVLEGQVISGDDMLQQLKITVEQHCPTFVTATPILIKGQQYENLF